MIVWQSARCLLSVTFSHFSFLDTGKAKFSRFALVTCRIRYFPFTTIFVQANRAHEHAWTDVNSSSRLPPYCSWKNNIFCSEDLSLETHDNTDTLLTPWNWWYCYIPTQYTSCFWFFSLYYKVQYHWLIIQCISTLDCEHKWHFIFVSPYQEENLAACEIRSCFIWC